MIEVIVKEFLESKLYVPVETEIPKNPAKRFVVIEKTGSTNKNQINSSILAIKSYAESKYEAALLNDEVKDVMMDGLEGLVTLDDVSSVILNSDGDFTDTTTKRYRYQAIFEIFHY